MADNLLGIDYGAKRIGVALAPRGERPHRLVTLASGPSLFHELNELVTDHAIDTVVVGLPRNLEGEETAQAAVVRAFARQLQTAYPQIVVAWQDETLTSEVAGERLRQQKVTHPATELDQEAAVIILEDYLDNHAS